MLVIGMIEVLFVRIVVGGVNLIRFVKIDCFSVSCLGVVFVM